MWCFLFFLFQKPRSEPPSRFSLPLTAANTQSAHSLMRGLTAIRTLCCSGEKERERVREKTDGGTEREKRGEGWEKRSNEQ